MDASHREWCSFETEEIRMLRKLIALFTPITVALLLAAPASAVGARQVAGTQTPVATCDGDSSALGTYVMDGSLIGCWFADSFGVVREHASGNLQVTGTEHFEGCLDLDGDGSCSGDPEGTLSFSFQFSGKFDLVTFAQIQGRCQHPILSGNGGFASASGVITFRDDVTTGIASYRGNIRL
jgi:hypothetical protein